MSDTAHTPGPWVALTDHGFPKEIRAEETGQLIATVRPDREHQIANARLIAAAPELLAALRNAVEAMELAGFDTMGGDTPAILEAARDALAKANGGAK